MRVSFGERLSSLGVAQGPGDQSGAAPAAAIAEMIPSWATETRSAAAAMSIATTDSRRSGASHLVEQGAPHPCARNPVPDHDLVVPEGLARDDDGRRRRGSCANRPPAAPGAPVRPSAASPSKKLAPARRRAAHPVTAPPGGSLHRPLQRPLLRPGAVHGTGDVEALRTSPPLRPCSRAGWVRHDLRDPRGPVRPGHGVGGSGCSTGARASRQPAAPVASPSYVVHCNGLWNVPAPWTRPEARERSIPPPTSGQETRTVTRASSRAGAAAPRRRTARAGRRGTA